MDINPIKWDALVGKRWMFLREDAPHYHFMHPTKGARKLSKTRIV